MIGSASRINAAVPPRQRVRSGCDLCPARSHVGRSGGTAAMPMDWAFVSPVSPVSPNLELIEEYTMGKQDRQRQVLVGALPAQVRQVGPVQQTCGFKVRHLWWNTGETGETAPPSEPRSR